MCKISRVIERTDEAASYEKQLDTLADGTQINVGSGVYLFESDYVPEGEWPPKSLRAAFRD